jgi:hypothetical protein
LAGVGAARLDHGEAGETLLGGADVEHTVGGGEGLESLPGDVVLTLPLDEAHDLDPLALGKDVDGLDEVPTDRGHQHRRGDLGAAMDLEEGGDAAASLQPRLIQVQIQPVDPFEVQGDMIFQHSATVWSTMIAGPG